MQNAGLDEAQPESRLLGEISITSDMQMTPPHIKIARYCLPSNPKSLQASALCRLPPVFIF